MNNKKSLLTVDDDIAHRTMLRILLDWEFEVFEADGGYFLSRQAGPKAIKVGIFLHFHKIQAENNTSIQAMLLII